MLQSCLLGQFSVSIDNQPIELTAHPAQLLLICLLLQPEIPHRREKLAGLLWPDTGDSSARNNLRGALWRARKALQAAGHPDWEYLLADDQAIRLQLQPEDWLDTTLLSALVTPDTPTSELLQTVSVYQGELLPGFYENWILAERRRMQAVYEYKIGMLLERLLAERRWREVIEWAERWIAQGDVPEPAFQALIRAHAGLGDLGGAAAQYRRCAEVLHRELGVVPSAQTRLALDQAQASGRTINSPAAGSTPHLPDFLQKEVPTVNRSVVFVGREEALARLDSYLVQAIQGHGQVAFVSGEAGSGKTALLQAFVHRSAQIHPELIAAFGACQAFFGPGDPYLPFRQVLALLTGEVEPAWRSGLVTRIQAQRTWALLPESLPALLETGPDLLETFLPGRALLTRAQAALPPGDPGLQRLQARLSQPLSGTTALQAQTGLFEQYRQVLRRLAERHPLVLVLDDLQWVDSGSAQLLFHLARNLAGMRVLMLGAFRPEDVAAGQKEARHPLEPLLDELRRRAGDILLDLDQIGERTGRVFVNALVDSEPNRLEEAFRNQLYHQTRGQPLFTVQLLRNMQERGEIVQDEDGRWTASSELDWAVLPPKVEGVIGARLNRLDPQLQEILFAAAVEGETFTVQVLEGLQVSSGRELLRLLSRELETRHRLVRELGEVQVGGRRLQRFRFSHALIQEYLYQQLGAAERRALHGEVAQLLESLYAEEPSSICALLARHFTGAGEKSQAIPYLLQAGDQAQSRYAHPEARAHYRQALAFQKELGDQEGAAQTLLKLNLVYHSAFDFPHAQQALKEGLALWKRSGQAGARPPLVASAIPFRTPMYDWINVGRFDPGSNYQIEIANFLKEIFCSLVESPTDMNILPMAAQSWEVQEDGRGYIFHLRPDLFWSDGQPVTAVDFEFAWKRALDPEFHSPMAPTLYDLRGARAFHQGQIDDPDQVGVSALDPLTLRVELEEPAAYFLHILTTNVCFAVPKHVVERYGPAWTEPDKIVTNGPFQIETWDPGRMLKFARNPRYPGRVNGNVDQVENIYYPNSKTAYEAFLAGELDAYGALESVVSPSELDRFRENGQLTLYTDPFVTSIHFMMDRPPFDDRRVRRAFVLAIDRQKLAEESPLELFLPATGGYVPPCIPGHSPGIGLPYDPEAARSLLAEAGFPDGRGFPNVSLAVSPARASWKACQLLLEIWACNLGIKITPPQPDKRYVGWNGEYNFFILSYVPDYPDPDSFLRANMLLTAAHWKNTEFDALIQAGRHTLDQNRRLEFYRQADRILIEEAALGPLLYDQAASLYAKRVLRFRQSGMQYVKWEDILIDPDVP